MLTLLTVLTLGCALTAYSAEAQERAHDPLREEVEVLKAEVEALRAQWAAAQAAQSNVGLSNHVSRISFSGLVQVWYAVIEEDSRGLFDSVQGIRDINSASDDDGFRIRRVEMKATLQIIDDLQAVMMIDPAREILTYPSLPDNQGTIKRQVIANNSGTILGLQTGAGAAPRLFQDGFLLYRGVPHHDLQLGQFKPGFGEEGGLRSSTALNFVERSLVGQLCDVRDIGAAVLGHWWDDRLLYQAGVFNGASNLWQTAGQPQSRADDNDDKDITARVILRPLWKDPAFGSLELGYAFRYGIKGGAFADEATNEPSDSSGENIAYGHDAWLHFQGGGPLSGLWLQGEWLLLHDNSAPNTIANLWQGGANAPKTAPFSASGFYAALGYRLDQPSALAGWPQWARAFEVAFRYEQFANVFIISALDPTHVDTFITKVWTGGINWNLPNHGVRLQLNGIFADDPSGPTVGDAHLFHEVHNNSAVLNAQIAY
jgi:hypothetical protein